MAGFGMQLGGELHTQGKAVTVPRPWATAMAWEVAARLLESHDNLAVVELHPGGGQYDCISVFERPASLVAHLNVNGSLTHNSWFEEYDERITWLEVAHNGAAWAAGLIAHQECLKGAVLSLSTEAVTTRVISQVMAACAMRSEVSMLSAVVDSSSWGASLREGLIAPWIKTVGECVTLGEERGSDVDAGARRWWFLTRNRMHGAEAVAVFDMHTATVWFDPETPGHCLRETPTWRIVAQALAILGN
jgi:hypothetical protein